MNNITEIELSKLVHHPQNPRKDLGDLTELTRIVPLLILTPRLSARFGISGMMG